jgi:Ni/Co efflux regulator RcnB
MKRFLSSIAMAALIATMPALAQLSSAAQSDTATSAVAKKHRAIHVRSPDMAEELNRQELQRVTPNAETAPATGTTTAPATSGSSTPAPVQKVGAPGTNPRTTSGWSGGAAIGKPSPGTYMEKEGTSGQ